MSNLLRLLFLSLLWCFAFSGRAQNALVADRADRSHVVFGYTQWNEATGPMQQYRWHALTHVGYTFVDFNIDGDLLPSHVTTFNDRTSELKYGGTAALNDVKVIVVVRNFDFNETILDTVMQDQALRENLADQIIALVSDPTNGCDGVNLDFEFVWGTDTRDGITAFFEYLYPRMKLLTPAREVSVYVHPTFSSTRYNVMGIRDYIDYMIYSGYDFATGGLMSAIGRYAGPLPTNSSIIKNCNDYLNAGMPPGRMVIALPTYGRTWRTNTPTYGQTGGASAVSLSWVDANFNATWRSPAYTKNHSTPTEHQGKWYSFATPADTHTHRLATFEDADTHAMKLDLARDWKGLTSTGAQLGGVAFWSLGWVGQGNAPGSVDPNDETDTVDTALRRTHSQPWTLWEEMFAPTTTTVYRAETFEATSLNPRWVDPNTSPDSVALGASTAIASAPAPAGAPTGKARVGALNFQFTNAVNRLLFKFQSLAGAVDPYPVDHFSSLVLVDSTVRFSADIHIPAAYPGTTIRMVVKDGSHQLEKSPPFALTTAGWQKITWNLNNPATVFGYATSEGGFTSGDGIIDTVGAGTRDIAFVGFEVVSSTASSGVINFGEITYSFPGSGTIDLDKNLYDVETSMTITVTDTDLAGQGTLPVQVTSSLEPTGEAITLQETAAPGTFSGEVLLHYHNVIAADGKLQTQPGDDLAAIYQNADDGTGNPSVETATADVRVPELILESREPSGAVSPFSIYEESTGFGSWSNTAAKSIAPGVTGLGGRFTGDLSTGAWAKFKPSIAVRGYYDVYITLPGNSAGHPTPSFFSFSPGAQFLVQGGPRTSTGTFDLSQSNPALADTWLRLAEAFYFDGSEENFIQLTNMNPTSSGSQRFGMDALRLVFVGSDPLPVAVTGWSVD